MNTYETLRLKNDITIKVTLNLKHLLQLKSSNKELYFRVIKILTKGIKHLFDVIDILYTGYLCASNETNISYDTFLELIPKDNKEIYYVANRLISVKNRVGFRNPFIKATKSMPSNGIKIPKFELEDIEDMYTYYVLILKISEDVFWNADFSFLLSIVENKTAYDSFVQYSKYLQSKN